MKNFVEYLLNRFETEAEGASYYDDTNDNDTNFQNELDDFFGRLTIYKDDAVELMSKYPEAILHAAILYIKEIDSDIMKYSEPETFVNAALSTIEDLYYSDFKKIFESH